MPARKRAVIHSFVIAQYSSSAFGCNRITVVRKKCVDLTQKNADPVILRYEPHNLHVPRHPARSMTNNVFAMLPVQERWMVIVYDLAKCANDKIEPPVVEVHTVGDAGPLQQCQCLAIEGGGAACDDVFGQCAIQ